MKVVIAGPSRSGKTKITNLLSQSSGEYNNSHFYDSKANDNLKYIATKGCRIVEVEFPDIINSSIEFWDIGGSCCREHNGYLPAIMDNADGIIFVYNPLDPLQSFLSKYLIHRTNNFTGGKEFRQYVSMFIARLIRK
mmetsp:Transcript_10246/g.12964  ORF Transcript_10246/g.12964 Transcript_10246/m.12964 type:complete len:137 (+) Transcript_10246:1152-1562(+)